MRMGDGSPRTQSGTPWPTKLLRMHLIHCSYAHGLTRAQVPDAPSQQVAWPNHASVVSSARRPVEEALHWQARWGSAPGLAMNGIPFEAGELLVFQRAHGAWVPRGRTQHSTLDGTQGAHCPFTAHSLPHFLPRACGPACGPVASASSAPRAATRAPPPRCPGKGQRTLGPGRHGPRRHGKPNSREGVISILVLGIWLVWPCRRTTFM